MSYENAATGVHKSICKQDQIFRDGRVFAGAQFEDALPRLDGAVEVIVRALPVTSLRYSTQKETINDADCGGRSTGRWDWRSANVGTPPAPAPKVFSFKFNPTLLLVG